MKIAVVSGGSRGDVQPSALLAQELARRGHTINFWAQASFRPLIETLDLSFFELGGAPPEKVMAELETHKPKTKIGKLRQILSGGRPELHRLQDLERAAADVDGVVLATMSSFGRHAVEGRGLPYVVTHVSPLYRTRHYPHPNLPFNPQQTKLRNFLTHCAFDQLFWAADRPWVNDWRKERLGLETLPRHAWHVSERKHPVLFGYSPAVLPAPPDWPQNCHVTGYWLPEESIDPNPSPQLLEFLQKPAIAIGFGSTIPPAPDFWKIIRRAVKELNMRAVIVKGWSNDQEELTDERFQTVSTIDYRWLFSKVSAVVHTGGSGVSSIALSAGKPSLTIPFGGDQRFWAWRLHELGVGTKPIPFAQFGHEIFRARLAELNTGTSMSDRALRLSGALSREQGKANAADRIEEHFRGWRS